MSHKKYDLRRSIWARFEPSALARIDKFTDRVAEVREAARVRGQLFLDAKPTRSWSFRQLVEVGLKHLEGTACDDPEIKELKAKLSGKVQ